MSVDRSTEYLAGLVRELRKLPQETEWVEFKHNNANPQELANTSPLWPILQRFWAK